MEIVSSRRTVLTAGALGAAACAAGCSVYGEKEPAASAETILGKAADVPVGGTKIYEKEKVVVSQPTAGQFKALSAVCTHAGCTVDKVENGKLICPCHGSEFNVADGSVAQKPAEQPLPARKIEVKGDDLVLLPE